MEAKIQTALLVLILIAVAGFGLRKPSGAGRACTCLRFERRALGPGVPRTRAPRDRTVPEKPWRGLGRD